MRRLGIFLFYDGNGIVSPHIHTSIRAFLPYMDQILFVCNGHLDRKSFERLEDNVTLLERENFGFDVWGYKAGIECIGYENLEKFDEIVFFNYTFFAPILPLAKMFEDMEARDLIDGWGMTEYEDAGKSFLQSYFLVTRKTLHTSTAFRSYWQEMPMINSINDSLDFHEFRFSKYFSEHGFKLEPYVKNRIGWNGNTTLTDVPALVEDGMPVIKYRSFNSDPDVIEARGGRKVKNNFDFVSRSTEYPISEIWEYEIAQTSPDALIAAAELCKIVPCEEPSAAESDRNVLILATIEDPETLDLVETRLSRFDSQNIYLASDNDDICGFFKEKGYKVHTPDSHRMLLRTALPEICAAADENTLVVHLSDFAQEKSRYFFKQSLFENFWDPLLSSVAHAWAMGNPHIGLAFPFPDSVFGTTSFKQGAGYSFENWEKTFRPKWLTRTSGQIYWPWRGNMIIKSSLATDRDFQNHFSDLLQHVAPRVRERLAGPEGVLPELARHLGYASAVVVPETEAPKLLLRAASGRKKDSQEKHQMALNFRDQLRNIILTNDRYSGEHDIHESMRKSLSWAREKEKNILIINNGSKSEELNLSLDIQFYFEDWTITDKRVHISGWAFDKDSSSDGLKLCLACDTKFLTNPMEFQLSRPDVLEAFDNLAVPERCGFELSVELPSGVDANKCRLVIYNPRNKVARHFSVQPGSTVPHP